MRKADELPAPHPNVVRRVWVRPAKGSDIDVRTPDQPANCPIDGKNSDQPAKGCCIDATSSDHPQKQPDPSEAEIAERCAEIQQEWDEAEEIRRRAVHPESWSIPEARVHAD